MNRAFQAAALCLFCASLKVPTPRQQRVPRGPSEARAVGGAAASGAGDRRGTSPEMRRRRPGPPSPPAEAVALAGAIVARTRPTASDFFHLWKLRAEFGMPDDPATGIGVMLEESSNLEEFAAPSLVATRHGVRCRTLDPSDRRAQPERQSHADQLIATLGELDVPLTRPLGASGGRGTVRDLLRDSIANFNPEQREIEWSALGLIFYLPPTRTWTDKFGKEFRFDDLATGLLSRDPGDPRCPCAGSHLLATAATLFRIDRDAPVLSEGPRSALEKRLRSAVAALIASQGPKGTWHPDWAIPPRDRDPEVRLGPRAIEGELLATGHHLEWLASLPADLRPPREPLERAAAWLERRAREILSGEVTRAAICPLTHAVLAIHRARAD